MPMDENIHLTSDGYGGCHRRHTRADTQHINDHQYIHERINYFDENGGVGEQGPEGPQGPAGPAGADGADGQDGAQGPQGDQGPQGIQGPAGNDGADGAQGPAGSDGADGQDGADGTVIEFFDVQETAGSGQLTTGTWADLAGIWGTPDFEDAAAFSWNGTTGELTINKTATIDLTAHVLSWNNLNNRHQLDIRLMYQPSGGSYSEVTASANYASRNNTQDMGASIIANKLIACGSGDKLKIQVRDIGVAATIGSSSAPFIGSYISAKAYS